MFAIQSFILNNNSVEKSIKIQQALFFSFLKSSSLKNKNIMKINYLIMVLIKMSLLTFLVFSQYGLACKYGIILQISFSTAIRIAFSDNWRSNCQSGKAIIEI